MATTNATVMAPWATRNAHAAGDSRLVATNESIPRAGPVPAGRNIQRMRFSRSLISDLDEPVRRFFTHAIRDAAALGAGVCLRMTGRIKVGTWLPFTAQMAVDGRA